MVQAASGPEYQNVIQSISRAVAASANRRQEFEQEIAQLNYRINQAEEKYNIDVYDPRVIMSFITTADVLRSLGELDYLL